MTDTSECQGFLTILKYKYYYPVPGNWWFGRGVFTAGLYIGKLSGILNRRYGRNWEKVSWHRSDPNNAFG